MPFKEFFNLMFLYLLLIYPKVTTTDNARMSSTAPITIPTMLSTPSLSLFTLQSTMFKGNKLGIKINWNKYNSLPHLNGASFLVLPASTLSDQS